MNSTAVDQEILQLYGTDLFLNTIVGTMCCISYGTFILGACIVLHSMITTGKHMNIVILMSLIVIFLDFTWNIVGNGGVDLSPTKSLLIVELPGGLITQFQATAVTTRKWEFINPWTTAISSLMGDGIVVWRAWILFQNNKFWRKFLLFILAVDIILNLADCIWFEFKITIELEGQRTALDWIAIVINICVNFCATMMIGWKAWAHHRTLAGSFFEKRSCHAGSIKILLLWIESGAVYCFIQTLYLATNVIASVSPVISQSFRFQLANAIIGTISLISAPLYPITVFLLIQTNGSPIVETFHHTQNQVETQVPSINIEEGPHREILVHT
ncbi:hypothetical protein BDP27DRAFT_1350068 [Rhodocollybia butyracea]|uniref:Uncharacterized protein n=1 Tax=Rhodocollybia butyracea TaxID=206335 RepID=A0A9P5P1T9_9AGAR|nr:hypothetical protein BDP27DRAFT_1350068 [Rhodocollybia butyracea]